MKLYNKEESGLASEILTQKGKEMELDRESK